MRANRERAERAGRWAGHDVPAEISEFLVDALESHGVVWLSLYVGWIKWEWCVECVVSGL